MLKPPAAVAAIFAAAAAAIVLKGLRVPPAMKG
jgi:hypothetical protein